MSPQQQIDSLKTEVARLQRTSRLMGIGFFTWAIAISYLVSWLINTNHVKVDAAPLVTGFAAAFGGLFGAWLLPTLSSLRDFVVWRHAAKERMQNAFFNSDSKKIS